MSTEDCFREQDLLNLVHRNRHCRVHAAADACLTPVRIYLNKPGSILDLQAVLPAGHGGHTLLVAQVLEQVVYCVELWECVVEQERLELVLGELGEQGRDLGEGLVGGSEDGDALLRVVGLPLKGPQDL